MRQRRPIAGIPVGIDQVRQLTIEPRRQIALQRLNLAPRPDDGYRATTHPSAPADASSAHILRRATATESAMNAALRVRGAPAHACVPAASGGTTACSAASARAPLLKALEVEARQADRLADRTRFREMFRSRKAREPPQC